VTVFDEVDLNLEREALAWTSTEGRRISRALPGYQGLLTLLDRDNRRLLGIGFYDNAESARQAAKLLGQVRPESLPEDLRRALPLKSYAGVLEVIERDGL
jgi:hypothetical protein